MNNRAYTDDIKIKFANSCGMLASRFSLNPTVGQIYGLLFLSNQPVSLNEMVEKLSISKGSASTNVRILESWGAVKKVWVDNTRKDYYEANIDIENIISNRLMDGLSRRLDESKQHMGQIEESLKKDFTDINGEQEFINSRMEIIRDTYNKIIDIMKFFKKDGNNNE